MNTKRREFLKSAMGGMVAAGVAAGTARAWAQGPKMKPGPRDVLLVVDVQNDFIPGGALPVKEAWEQMTKAGVKRIRSADLAV